MTASKSKPFAAASASAPSPTQGGDASQPRADKNAGSNSMLAAAIGLTSLGGPSPLTDAAPSLGADCKASVAAKASEGPVHVPHDAGGDEIARPPPALGIASPLLPRPEPAAAMPPPLARLHAPPYHHGAHLNLPHPSIPTAMAAGARPPILEKPTPYWSPALRPAPPGFDALPPPHLGAHPYAPPASDAVDPLSAGERLAAMDRAASFAAGVARASHPFVDPFYPNPYAPRLHGTGAMPAVAPPPPHHPANNKNFPETLFEVISSQENAHIISWLPHGQGFIIHDKDRFHRLILPRYFDGAKFTSFTRRLKRWNFVRVPRGPEMGAYYNKDFVRGRLELVQEMRYQSEGKSAEAKKKKGGDEDEEKKGEAKEGDEKKGASESKVQSSSSENRARGKDSSPSLAHPNQALPANAPVRNPESNSVHLAGPRGRPSRSKTAAHHSLTAKNALRNPPPVHIEHSPSFPTRHPGLAWPNDPNEQRYGMMPHGVPPNGARLMPSSGVAGPAMSGGLPNHPFYPHPPPQRKLDVEHMEHGLGQDYRNSIGNGYARHDVMAPRTLGPLMPRDEMMGAPLSRGHVETHGIGMHGEARGRGGRRVMMMMSQEEEQEFASYLIEKRRARAGGAIA